MRIPAFIEWLLGVCEDDPDLTENRAQIREWEREVMARRMAAAERRKSLEFHEATLREKHMNGP